MDTYMQNAQKAIGGSSDVAQLALSYYFDNISKGIDNDETKQYYDNFVILAVLAQCAIDGCKRLYAVNVEEEIKRIRSQSCMKREKDFPKFMVYTKDIPVSRNGRERPNDEIRKDREKIRQRVDEDIICPMNWLQECLDKIQGSPRSNSVDNLEYLSEKPEKRAVTSHMTKIRRLVEEYDGYMRHMCLMDFDDKDALMIKKTDEILAEISKIKVSKATMYRLIQISFGYEGRTNKDKRINDGKKYSARMLNLLYKSNREKFLSCFKSQKIAASGGEVM